MSPVESQVQERMVRRVPSLRDNVQEESQVQERMVVGYSIFENGLEWLMLKIHVSHYLTFMMLNESHLYLKKIEITFNLD